MVEGTIARLRPWHTVIGLFTIVLPLAWLACQELPARPACGALPDEGACPTTRGGTCVDSTCSALYQCTDAGWAFVQRCEGGGGGGGSAIASGGAGGGGAGASGAGGAGALACEQVSRDPACSALQPPDCDEASARACPLQACLGQCDVFLACTPSGWSDEIAGYCDEEELVLAAVPGSRGNGN